MEKIFGIPLDGVMLFLSIVLGSVLLLLLLLGTRHIVLVKLGLRNIPRRKSQTSLIIFGLMLSTLIITAALGVGDTIAYSIKDSAVTNLGNLDISVVKAPSPTAALLGNTGAEYFKPEEYAKLKAQIEANDKVRKVVPAIIGPGVVTNLNSKLTKSEAALAAFPPDFTEAWGQAKSSSGKSVNLGELGPSEAYATKSLTKLIGAKPGDEVRVYIEKQPVTLKIKDTLDLDIGASPTLVMGLADYQQRANRAGQIQQIWMSLKGAGGLDNVQYSAEVTRYLRAALADSKAMDDLKTFLSQASFKNKLEEQARKLPDANPAKARLKDFLVELDKTEVSDDFKRLSQDTLVGSQLLQMSSQLNQSQQLELFKKTAFLSNYKVSDDKASAIDLAESVGSQFTAFFLVFALFSISVGVLLIFLIFVMLATERKAEMGMARALGIKRRHLTEMFVFEGTVYSLMAALVGVTLGVGVGAGMVIFMSSLIASENFQLKTHIEPRSLIISFCLGMVLTFVVVAFSAYRVSRLNIVAAIRDLEEDGKGGTTMLGLITGPFRVIAQSFKMLFKLKFFTFLGGITFGLLGSVFAIFWGLFTRGPLALLLGYTLASVGVDSKQQGIYALGCSFLVIGLGLLVRWVLRAFQAKKDLADRIGYTLAGLLLVFFWARPFGDNFFEKLLGLEDSLHLKEMEAGIDMFFISGIMLVAGTIWAIMYNSDLIIKGVMLLISPIGKFAPVTRTALAYPLSSKFRTGMLLAMFSLITFVILFISVLTDITNKFFDDADRSTGGWEIVASASPANPVGDIYGAVAANPTLKNQLNSVSAAVLTPEDQYQLRQVGAKEANWSPYQLQAVDDNFLKNSLFKFSLKADGYLSDQQILDAVRTQPNLAILSTWAIGQSGGNNGQGFAVTGIDSKAKTFAPFELEVRDQAGTVKRVKVIGFMDKPYYGLFQNMLLSQKTLTEMFSLPADQLKPTNYYFDVKSGIATDTARVSLGQAFAENGLEPKNISEEIKKDTAVSTGFNTLFQFFAGLGLLVGIAGLGVISTRVVVERRQQIGMLRAIGYSRGLVQLSFLLESSFIAILGLVIGAVLGLWTSYKFIQSAGGFEFSIPWLQVIGILVGSYLATLLTTYLPARAAAKVYPAEALRYE